MGLTVGELTGYADLDDTAFETALARVSRGMIGMAEEITRLAAEAGDRGGQELGDGLADGAADGAEESNSAIAAGLKGVAVVAAAAGVAAGAALIGGVTEALERQPVAGRLGAQLGATPELAQEYGRIAGHMWADAVTEDVQGAADSIRMTMASGLLPTGATDAQIQQMSTRVSDLANTFELDLGQAANAAGQMIKTGLAKDGTEALDVMARGLQVMGPRADDLGDTFNEYSTIFRQLGLSASQATGLLAQGMAAGARDTDVVADSLKELTLITQGGGEAVDAAFKKLGLSGDAMQKAFVQGGPKAAAGLDQLLSRLREMKDPVDRQAVALALFGTKSEDVQKALYSLDPSTAVAALGQVSGAADGLGTSLRDNGATRLEQFKRGAEEAFVEVIGGRVLPVVEEAAGALADRFGPSVAAAVSWLREHLVPAAKDVAGWLRDDLAPAVMSVARWLRDDLVPAVASAVDWVDRNSTSLTVAASVITALLLPVLITLTVSLARAGIAATISGAQQVAAWVTSGGAATINGALSVAASYRTVGGWIAAGAAAVLSGLQQVAAWVGIGARALWGMALQAGAAAAVVAGWILMGAQSMLQAARMAAAWLIALGPIGWITAAVIAIVALIIVYWDEIKAATVAAWSWVVDKVKWAAQFMIDIFLNFTLLGLLIKHWDSIKQGAIDGWNATVDWIRQVPGWIYGIFLNFTPLGLLIKHWQSIKQGAVDGFMATIEWIALVPVKIYEALGDLGSLLVSKGADLVRGLWQGIQNMGGWLRDKLTSWARSAIPGPIADALGINSLSRVMADQIGRWIPAGIISGIESGTGALDRTMAALVTPPPAPIGAGPLTGVTGASGGAAGGFHIQNYYEAPGASARSTAEELTWLANGRGSG